MITRWRYIISAVMLSVAPFTVIQGVKTFTYLGSTLAVDGELDAEVTHRVQSGWKNWKRVSGVLCDRRMNVKIKGECVQDSGKTSTDVRGRDMGVE